MTKKSEYIKGDHFLFKTRVLANAEIAPGKYLLSLEKTFDFRAGHVVAIAADESHAPRIYSICSGENEHQLQILFDKKEDGVLTPRMARLIKGDFLFVSKPYGSFLPETDDAMWFIATGTGIAPFHSMIGSGYIPVRLLHGAREGGLFYFERKFKTVLKENYIRCSSGSDGVGDYFGRVTAYLEQNEVPLSHKYYLCGRALMVVEVRDILIAKGVPYENIISEIFF